MMTDLAESLRNRPDPLKPVSKPVSIDLSAPLVISEHLAAQLRGDKPIGEGKLGAKGFIKPATRTPQTLEEVEECIG